MDQESGGEGIRLSGTDARGHEAAVIFHMTTPTERTHNRWKLFGIYLTLVAFVGLAIFNVFSESDRRNANRDTLERLEIENKKTREVIEANDKRMRDALFGLYKYDKAQFEAILKHLEKK